MRIALAKHVMVRGMQLLAIINALNSRETNRSEPKGNLSTAITQSAIISFQQELG
jgi:hypothetical protein